MDDSFSIEILALLRSFNVSIWMQDYFFKTHSIPVFTFFSMLVSEKDKNNEEIWLNIELNTGLVRTI